jgi:hypothetical protein
LHQRLGPASGKGVQPYQSGVHPFVGRLFSQDTLQRLRCRRQIVTFLVQRGQFGQ